ncbi:iron-containing alcohol dehydrogenase [Bordetella trematum]|uniref:iron-containing alcohol dehydrogenase n=1 Tax=Bordetella trematum TaxID=123899 RepID=UPI003989F097
MTAFRFQTVPTLVAEFGAARRLGSLLREHYPGLTGLCLVTDAFLYQSGLLAPALANLAETGWQVSVIDNVVADPPEQVVLQAAELARQARAELILGLGGGSSMDVAKLLAVLAAGRQPLTDMYGLNQVQGPRLPLVQMPTTAGTGSEVTAVSIVTTGATSKMGVVSSVLLADLAILDAELTLDLPPSVTAATGIDAMVHAIEAYTSKRLKNPLSDMLALRALALLSRHLLAACENGHDRQAREAMMLGAMLAGQAFANAPVAAVHALAYPLGGVFHVPHGLSNSLVLPPVLKFNAPAAHLLYAELADALLPHATGSNAARCDAFIDHLERLIAATGIPRTLREVGVTQADLPRLARDAMQQTRLLVNNPRELNEADALAIYSAVL